ncbi:lysozyme [Vibrio cholerae]|uniref:lysozyme n=1 Tax=Vibrio cholerae TaxID=666 RepID=UPI0016525EA0|nr:lysozyme [Vibrio cholerae]
MRFPWVDSKRSLVFSSNGMALLREIEELRLIPYDDQTGKSISSYVEGATIGYGYLIPKNEWSIYKNGITKEIAEELFLRKVPRFQENVQSKIKVDINQNQFDALVLLCYNIGEGNFNSSSVLKLVNGGSAPVYGNNIDNAWLAWNKSQGKVMQGLIKRRKCELNVYHKGVYEKW